jgi:hypothetical protein
VGPPGSGTCFPQKNFTKFYVVSNLSATVWA